MKKMNSIVKPNLKIPNSKDSSEWNLELVFGISLINLH